MNLIVTYADGTAALIALTARQASIIGNAAAQAGQQPLEGEASLALTSSGFVTEPSADYQPRTKQG